MAGLFISYAHKDGGDLASRLAADLAHVGYSVWLDKDRLRAAATWTIEIETHIDSSDAVIALLSRGSYVSDICRAEQLRALRHDKRVIPALIQRDAERPLHLETRQYLDGAAEYAAFFDQIKDAVNSGEGATLTAKYRHTYSTVPQRPLHFIPRPSELEKLRKILIADNTERRIAVTALRAMGGIGKTVLAQVVCSDRAIEDAFPDGVMWTVIGQSPTDSHLITQMREIAKALGDELAGYDTLQGCGNQFRKTLADKACLIVLDDVWDPRHVQPFIADAPRCRLLLTTRQREVVKSTGAQEHCLDVLEPEEAQSLLARSSGVPTENLPAEAADIIDECGRLPLALAMIGSLVRGETTEVWARVLRRLQAADLDKIRLQFPDYPHPSILRAIQVSVDSLEPEARSRYLQFAVFPPDTPIPLAALKTFWGIGPDDVADVVDSWAGASLASRTEGGVTLHGLQLDYVRKQADNVRPLHEKLVEKYRALCGGNWASGPDDGYFFTWLSYHLSQAGRNEELLELLLDPKWMRAKLDRKGVAALLADYDRAPRDSDLELVKGALRLSGHVLGKHPDLLTSQLTGRLLSVSSAAMRKLIDEARLEEPGPWIEATRQTLKPPGGPLIRTLAGHEGDVMAVAMTPDGRRAVSGSADETLKVWDLDRGEAIRTLDGHVGGVRTVAVTPDGQCAVSGADDGSLKVWDVERGELIRTLTGHTRRVTTVAVTPDGKHAVSGSADRTLKVWNLERAEVIRTLHAESWVSAVAVTPDGQRAVSSSAARTTLKLWDIEGGELIRTLEAHHGDVMAVAVTPTDQRAVSGSYDRTLKLWDLERGEVIRTLKGHAGWVMAVAVTPDGQRAISGSDDRTLKVWDLQNGKVIRTLGGHAGLVTAVALTRDGRYAVSGSYDGTLKVWDLERGEAIPTLEEHARGVRAAAVTADGRRAVSGSYDGTLKVWDLERGTVIRTLEGHAGGVSSVSVTPDNQRAVSASYDATLRVWDLERGSVIQTLLGHAGWVMGMAVMPDGRYAVSASSDRTLRVWDLERGEVIRTLEGHADGVNSVEVTPDGRHAVSGSSDRTLKVWDLGRGEVIRTLEGHAARINSVEVTPDGQHAVSGSSDRTLKVWDLGRGVVIRTWEGHAGWVRAVAVTPDGQRVVSTSDDRTLRVWDLLTGASIGTFGGESSINCCAVLPDGCSFLAGEESGTLHFLRLMSRQINPPNSNVIQPTT